jgi:hypothetical protein
MDEFVKIELEIVAFVKVVFVELIKSLLSVPVDRVVITLFVPVKLVILELMDKKDDDDILIEVRLPSELLFETRLSVVILSLAKVVVLMNDEYKLLLDTFEPIKLDIVAAVAVKDCEIRKVDVVKEFVSIFVEIILGEYKFEEVAYVVCRLTADMYPLTAKLEVDIRGADIILTALMLLTLIRLLVVFIINEFVIYKVPRVASMLYILPSVVLTLAPVPLVKTLELKLASLEAILIPLSIKLSSTICIILPFNVKEFSMLTLPYSSYVSLDCAISYNIM